MHTAARTKQQILLVDDEPQVLVALEDLLSDDYIVLKTTSPHSAIELLGQEADIALIMTDQRMPTMTGEQLLAQMDQTSDAQRIMVTGFADLAAVIRAVNSGKLFAYVTKPWNADELLSKVDQAVEQIPARAPAHQRAAAAARPARSQPGWDLLQGPRAALRRGEPLVLDDARRA